MFREIGIKTRMMRLLMKQNLSILKIMEPSIGSGSARVLRNRDSPEAGLPEHNR